MSPGPHLRSAVLSARETLTAGRAALRQEHEAGVPGVQVSARLTDLLDRVLMDLYRDAIEETYPAVESQIALVALGGYGRRDVAPYSDVDLMVLYASTDKRRVRPFVRMLSQGIVDAGLELGCQTCTPHDARTLAMEDATIFTALVDSRFLAGGSPLFSQFAHSFRHVAQRHSSMLIDRIESSRSEERSQYGETVYLLEPNVKRSRGGLRDLQLLRWIGYARHGEREPESLVQSGVLFPDDYHRMQEAHAFLLRLRNELHFHAGKAQDLFDKGEQLRIAEQMGYETGGPLLPVERLLRDYIEHTNDVRYGVEHFLASAKMKRSPARLLRRLFSQRLDGDFRRTTTHVGVTEQGLRSLGTDFGKIMRLVELANLCRSAIDHSSWVAIRESMGHLADVDVPEPARSRFLAMMSHPGRLAGLLRRLHELRVLEKLIPPMAHARGLMQFNEYHKYTIDEHCIRTVEEATGFADDRGPLGKAYRGIRDKLTLHLALLIHDLGKGYDGDHSEVGGRLAEETAVHLGLGKRDTETLVFLVEKHLRMSHTALRRDIGDDGTVLRFAVEVGTPERLQMLFVISCADLAAVGPGVLTRWKQTLITRLYERAREHLVDEADSMVAPAWIAERQAEIRRRVPDAEDAWWDRQMDGLPHRYLEEVSADQIVRDLTWLRDLPHDQVFAHGRYLPDGKVCEYTVGTYEEIAPGIFHRLTGALTSKGLAILGAEIHTLAQDLVLDRFFVRDLDFEGEPPSERMQEIVDALIAALRATDCANPTFRKLWGAGRNRACVSMPPLPTQVRIDNGTSSRYTILEIFAHDRLGLLYAISKTLFDLGLSVHVAKIGTYVDQVVDVFYVTTAEGKRVVDESRVADIQERIIDAIEEFPG